MSELPELARKAHINFSTRFLRQGLPKTAIDNDSSRLVIAFYCLATLDLFGSLDEATRDSERNDWREWLWAQQIQGPWGSGFRASPSIGNTGSTEYDAPGLIITYAALLSLAILRDRFTRLDREGLAQFVKSSQREDGSFRVSPSSEEYDLRITYCAFSICSMLDDWSIIDVEKALAFIQSCRSYEGGYGQEPKNEAQGGTTYCALASLYLAPTNTTPLTPKQRDQTIRWLLYNQEGGFKGRTNKEPDACYCFWCGASCSILGVKDLVNDEENARFLLGCQFRFGGIQKAPDASPDPYHTYLALASLTIWSQNQPSLGIPSQLDPLLNATEGTKAWIDKHLRVPRPQ